MDRSVKLFSRSTRYYFLSFFIFLLISAYIFYYLINHRLNEEVDEQLNTEMIHIQRIVSGFDSVVPKSMLLNDALTIRRVNMKVRLQTILFDTVMWDDVERESIPYRVIRFSAESEKDPYIVTIKKSKLETIDLIYSIFISFLFLYAFLVAMLLLTNLLLNKSLWAPFLKTINKIKSLRLGDQDVVFLPEKTSVIEFEELNSALFEMTLRIKSEYGRMKEFSENAAHELQTPVTIIRTKLESILQNRDLDENTVSLVGQALDNAIRLSRITQTLLLLTKIEHDQYGQKEEVNFSLVIEKYLSLYNDLITDAKLELNVIKEEEFRFGINPILASMLISNLLGNAIHHNTPNGFLRIQIYRDGFEIVNSGEPPAFPPEEMFTRFIKGSYSSEHTGLGLALVKEISVKSGLEVSYTYNSGRHSFKLFVPSKTTI